MAVTPGPDPVNLQTRKMDCPDKPGNEDGWNMQ